MRFKRSLQTGSITHPILKDYITGSRTMRLDLFNLFMSHGLDMDECVKELVVHHLM